MTARELEDIQEKLSHQGRRLRVALVLACGSAIAALAVLAASIRLAGAFGLVAALEATITAITRHTRGELVGRLALDADAYAIPEVAEYGRRCAEKGERDRTAAWLREVVAQADGPDSIHLTDRVTHHARDLERIASELASATRVRPPAAVACRRLLTHAVESPLYNPRLPTEELSVALERIHRGIRLG
jgi:hypothetical protein